MNDDLISRSALKKALEVTQYNDIDDLTRTERLIDNAPTVDVKPFALFSFDKDELEQIVRDRVIEPIKNGELVVKTEERPQIFSCFNCKYDYKSAADEPCKYCEKHCEWQAKEADND